MSGIGETPPEQRTVDAQRLRRMGVLSGSAVGLGVALAVLLGLLGAEGRVGLAVLLLVWAFGAGVTALYGGVTLLRDDLRSVPISRRRIVLTLVLFALAAVFMALVAGVGG